MQHKAALSQAQSSVGRPGAVTLSPHVAGSCTQWMANPTHTLQYNNPFARSTGSRSALPLVTPRLLVLKSGADRFTRLSPKSFKFLFASASHDSLTAPSYIWQNSPCLGISNLTLNLLFPSTTFIIFFIARGISPKV